MEAVLSEGVAVSPEGVTSFILLFLLGLVSGIPVPVPRCPTSVTALTRGSLQGNLSLS